MPCITRTFDPSIGPTIQLGVTLPQAVKAVQKKNEVIVTAIPALVDTGADMTCVSPQIAKQIGLPLLGKLDVGSVHGVQAANFYLADILLPFGDPNSGQAIQTLISEAIEVMEFNPNSQHYQAILGRDILSKGYFSMTSYDKRFTICM